MLCDSRHVRVPAVASSVLLLLLGGLIGCGEAPKPGAEEAPGDKPVVETPSPGPEKEAGKAPGKGPGEEPAVPAPPSAPEPGPEETAAPAEPEDTPAAVEAEPEERDEKAAARTAAELFASASAKEKQKDIDGAIADYTKAIELKADYVEALYYRAGLHYQKEDADAAIADLTRVIELKPDYALAYTGRGYVYQSEGRKGLARADYVKAATLDPEGAAGRIARKNLELSHGGVPPELRGSVLLDVCFENRVLEGADGEAATTTGDISFEAGATPGAKAIRISGVGAHVQYGASGNVSLERGTVFLRLKADQWDDDKHSGIWSAFGSSLVLSKYKKWFHLQYMKSMSAAGSLRYEIVSLDDARFHDVCVTWQPRDIGLFVDGELADSADDYFVVPVRKPFAHVDFGALSDNVEAWHGLVARGIIFERALTRSEVHSLCAGIGGLAGRD